MKIEYKDIAGIYGDVFHTTRFLSCDALLWTYGVNSVMMSRSVRPSAIPSVTILKIGGNRRLS